ncbi:MAG TPA: asparagine synthase (glutamine-hydrolyzing), partial [Blastocatellia bacterium]
MCGIIAICSYERPLRSEELDDLLPCLAHRGPDDCGVMQINTQIGFAHARLAIIDLSPAGHQPMRDPATGNVITYNGEIYNYRELRDELVALGHEFHSTSDTEVLLKAYSEWGGDCLRRLQGMFAFALWDASRRGLFVARDRLGIKPLYYLQGRDRLMIASEIKVFHRALEQAGALALNEAALPYYLTMRCVPTDETLMAGVRRLGPGRCLWVEPATRRLEETRYWRLEDAARERAITEAEALEEIEARLRRAVRRRLVADVQVGCFLSGGVDSSLLTLIASQEASAPVHSFSVDFEEAGFSERPHFDYVARQAKTESHVFTMNPRGFLEFLDDWVYFMDDLVSDPSSLPLYFVAREAQRHNIKVVLSGEGADELFGGYDSYLQIARFAPWQGVARRVGWAARLLTGQADRQDLLWRLGTAFPFRGTAYVFGESYRGRFLKHDFSLDDWLAEVYAGCRELSPINRMLYFDLATRIPADLLIRTDRVTMAASVECRVPFLDHELVEAVVGLPAHMKVRDGVGKHILKQLACRFLPEAMVYRPKVGFAVPLGQWFNQDLRSLLESIFLRERRIGALNYEAIAAMLDEHWKGVARHEGRIWNLLAL